MIVVLKPNTDAEREAQLIEWFKSFGLGVHVSEG